MNVWCQGRIVSLGLVLRRSRVGWCRVWWWRSFLWRRCTYTFTWSPKLRRTLWWLCNTSSHRPSRDRLPVYFSRRRMALKRTIKRRVVKPGLRHPRYLRQGLSRRQVTSRQPRQRFCSFAFCFSVGSLPPSPPYGNLALRSHPNGS